MIESVIFICSQLMLNSFHFTTPKPFAYHMYACVIVLSESDFFFFKISFGINITHTNKKLALLVSEVDQFHDQRRKKKERALLRLNVYRCENCRKSVWRHKRWCVCSLNISVASRILYAGIDGEEKKKKNRSPLTSFIVNRGGGGA